MAFFGLIQEGKSRSSDVGATRLSPEDEKRKANVLNLQILLKNKELVEQLQRALAPSVQSLSLSRTKQMRADSFATQVVDNLQANNPTAAGIALLAMLESGVLPDNIKKMLDLC